MLMDTTSTTTRKSHTTELDKFKLYYELVPAPKTIGRIKRSHVSGA